MKQHEYTLMPETVAEKDGIAALKSAMNENSGAYSQLFAFGGQLMAEVDAGTLAMIIADFEAIEADEYGRDENGLDIAAAIRTLEHVKGI